MASNINTTNIDTAYPVAGQDNDSQGFRDNFFNTNQNFIEAKTEIEALQGASAGNYVFDITQVPDNSMDNWVLTYDHNAGVDSEIRLTALPVADETTAGIIELATQIEVDGGTNAVTAVTPLTLQNKITDNAPTTATDSAEGIIELATQAEVDTGTDTSRAVTPATLQGKLVSASETVEGIIELATQAEVDTGTDAVRAVTPATLAGAIAETDTTYGTTGAIGLDLATGSFFYPTGTTTGIITFSFNNPAATGTVTAFTMKLQGAGDFAPVWPAGVDWPAATEPTWTAGGLDIVSFITHDGGTTWVGMLGGLAFA